MSVSEIKRCLQNLAYEALIDEGDNIMAVEILWTPSDSDNVISPRDVIMDYPDLIRLN